VGGGGRGRGGVGFNRWGGGRVVFRSYRGGFIPWIVGFVFGLVECGGGVVGGG